MTLIEGPAYRAATPVTHAFVVGVSEYLHLGEDGSPFGQQFHMESLTSPARSASEIAAWLLTEYYKPEAPLATLRILLSPTAGEQLNGTLVDALGAEGRTAPATRQAVKEEFREFMADCAKSTQNFAFVYIVGHGVQLSTSASVVLLHDFAAPAHGEDLEGAIDVAGCHRGMSGAGNPDRQVWFADACRQVPAVAKSFEFMTGAYTTSKKVGDVEASALYLAAGPRETAFAEVGGTSMFSQALLWALRGGSANDVPGFGWCVRGGTLGQDLQDRLDVLTAARDLSQQVEPIGRSARVIVQRFELPPECDLEVTLRPPEAAPSASVRVGFNGQPLPVGAEWPVRTRVPAGAYAVDVDVQPPLTNGWHRNVEVRYPGRTLEAEVS